MQGAGHKPGRSRKRAQRGTGGRAMCNTVNMESGAPTCSSSDVAVAAPVVRLTAKVACSTRQALPEMVVALVPVERTVYEPWQPATRGLDCTAEGCAEHAQGWVKHPSVSSCPHLRPCRPAAPAPTPAGPRPAPPRRCRPPR